MIWYPYEQMKTMREPYKILDLVLSTMLLKLNMQIIP